MMNRIIRASARRLVAPYSSSAAAASPATFKLPDLAYDYGAVSSVYTVDTLHRACGALSRLI